MPVRRDGALAEVFASFEDISERLELARELRRQACTDELTGVANRRRFMERLQAEHERLLRHPHLQCALLALDIDHFKQVNDTHGHAAGDAVLVEVARAMRLATRQQDLVARWGGEEFMILLPDTGRAEATALAQRLRRQVQSARIAHGAGVLGVTVSIGVGALSSADDALEHVLRRADRALYRAKSAGRNAVAADGEPA
ncbi:MAG TPA: GGDEF domain-containing protein [Rubrivivax sp.]|nr:GGDEF domain-containing protein [Rubrivivax sp.]